METKEYSGIKLAKEKLLGYAFIDRPGKYALVVANNVSPNNVFTDENGSRYIVNLKAISLDKAAQVREAFKDAVELPIEETQGLFMTGSIWQNQKGATVLPMKNEKVNCTVDFVPNREGEEVLRITNIQVLPAKESGKFSFEGAETPAAEAEQSSSKEIVHAK